MASFPEQPRFTETEYLALEKASEIRHEFADGYILAMSGASVQHLKITANIHGRLFLALQERTCFVFQSEMRVRVANTRSYFYPDITVVCGEEQYDEDESVATLLNPLVIVEVLSPSTELYDRKTKFQQYQRISSLQHYVLVEQTKPRLECFSRADNDRWILSQAEGRDALLELPSLAVTLALRQVYEQIAFADDPTG